MKKVIDVRDMHTAIHSLYLVNHKPQTTLDMFKSLENDALDEIEQAGLWDRISENVENLGEINYRYFKGEKVWINHELVSDVIFDDGENKYKVIGSFDIW